MARVAVRFLSGLLLACLSCGAVHAGNIALIAGCNDNPAVQSILPDSFTQGQVVWVTLLGRELDKGSVSLDFGAGIVVQGKPSLLQKINDQMSSYRVALNILPTAPPGAHPVLVRYCNGSQSAPTNRTVTVTAACTEHPVLTALTPPALSQGQNNAILSLTGRELDKPGVALDFGPGILAVGKPLSKGGGSYSLAVNVLPGAPVGVRPVFLRYCNGSKKDRTRATITVSAASTPSPPGGGIVQVAPVPPPAAVAPTPGVGISVGPSLTGIFPFFLEAGKSRRLDLHGKSFADGMEVRFGPGVKTAGKVKVLTPTLAQVDVEVDATASGQRKVELRSGPFAPWSETGTVVLIKSIPKAVQVVDVAPLCQPMEVLFQKGEIKLAEPKPYVEEPDHGQTSLGAPLLTDAVRLKWEELKPGLPDYYELVFSAPDGKVIRTVRLDGKTVNVLGKKIRLQPPTLFHPDAEFLQKLVDAVFRSKRPLTAQAVGGLSPIASGPSGSGTGNAPNLVRAGVRIQGAKKGTGPSNSLNLSAYPPETDLFWEVVGYKEYRSDCGFLVSKPPASPPAPAPGAKKKASPGTGKQAVQISLPEPPHVNPAKTLVVEVERSERWPLSLPARAGGLTACSAGGQTTGSVQVKNISPACVYEKNPKTGKWECAKEQVNGQWVNKVDPNNYPGDEFQLTGQFTLGNSPYAPVEEMKEPPPPPPNSNAINFGLKVPTGNFLNIVVDWGDGSVSYPVHMTYQDSKKPKGSYGSLVTRTYTLPDTLKHRYDQVGSYNVRIYLLSDEDMQSADIQALAQSVDRNSNDPYLLLASAEPDIFRGMIRGRGALTMTDRNAAIASRAYTVFCKQVDIRAVEDTEATGPLHLDSIRITGFPGHEPGKKRGGKPNTAGPVQVGPVSLSPKRGAFRKTPSGGGTGLSVSMQPSGPASSFLAGGPNGAPGAVATACDESMVAEAEMGYYGQGEVRIRWMREGKVVRQEDHPVPPSEQRKNLPKNPAEWGPPKISIDDTLPNSGNLLEGEGAKSIGDHSVSVSATVLVKPSLPYFKRYVVRGIGDSSYRKVTGEVLSRKGPGGAVFKVGFLSPARVRSGGSPPVLYANDFFVPKRVSVARPALLPSKPNYVASEPVAYRVKESDPSQPCTFLFVDKDKGEFRISGLNGNVVRKGSTYSGHGVLLIPLNKSPDGEPETYPFPIDFSNWKVADGIHLDPGTQVSVSPKKPISAPGVEGTLDSIEGTAGDRMTATLSLRLMDTLRLAGGTEKPPEWNGRSSRLYANGDWYLEDQVLPDTFIGWSSFKISSKHVTFDLSRTRSAGTLDPLCGAGGDGWIGVHLGDATLTPYTMDLVPTGGWSPPTVTGWAIVGDGVCGKSLVNQSFTAKIDEGSVHFDAIDVISSKGTFHAVYKNMVVHVPWLDTDLKGDAVLQYAGGGDKGISFPLSGKAELKKYGNITMQADKLAFTREEGLGWVVRSDTHFDFSAEGKPFSSFDVAGLFFGFDGKAYFEKAGTAAEISLGGPSVFGLTPVDLVSVSLDSAAGGSDRLRFTFHAKLHLSKRMPSADASVIYSIRRDGSNYAGSGPTTGPFTVKVAFPPGQPTVQADIRPSYTGPVQTGLGPHPMPAVADCGAGGGTAILDAPLDPDPPWRAGERYASAAPTPCRLALFGGGGDGDRYNGTIDLAMFGGPPVAAEFRLGYNGGDDYWLTRATIGLGSAGISLVPPFLNLYALRGGLGNNFPINAFQDPGSLSSVSPDMSGTYMFMAGMRVGSPDTFAYTLDGDFTVKLGTGARMDFRAWLLDATHTGQGTFHGYFQYAGGNFDGMLAGKMSLLGDVVYMEIPENAATLHFGGGNWRIAAGKKEGPRIKAHLFVENVNGYLSIGNEGYEVGGGMSYKLHAGIGYIAGSVDGGLEITPQPHISGHLNGAFAAKICAYDVCIGPSLTAGVNMSALPVHVGAHACFEIPIPFWNPDVCGNFTL
ncbi:MAG: hypothetical protein Kow00128_19560 [Deltaproteobacteria bacterium]